MINQVAEFLIRYNLDNLFGLFLIGTTAVILIAGFTLLAYIAYKKKTIQAEEFEKTPLSDYVLTDVENILDNFGREQTDNIDLRYNLHPIGEVWKDTKLSGEGAYEELTSDSNNKLNEDVDVIDEDGLSGDKLVKEGFLDKEELEDMEDNGIIPHRIIATRPRSRLSKVQWLVSDRLLGANNHTDYYLCPEPLVLDGGDHIQIPRNIQFRNFGGVEFPMYRSSMAILMSIVNRHLLEATLEDLENYSNKLNHLDPGFSQDMQKTLEKLEKEKELEKAGKGVAGDVNKG